MEAWCVKTGHFPARLFGHQNGQRNEATQCVNQSGFQNEHPRRQCPPKAAKNGFEQKATEIPKKKLGHPDTIEGPEEPEGRAMSRPLFEVFALSLFRNASSRLLLKVAKNGFEQKATEIPKKKLGHPDTIEGPEEPEGRAMSRPLFEVFALSLFKNPSSRLLLKVAKNDFEQKLTKIPKKKLGHPDTIEGPEEPEGRQ
jgi:S-adenosylmethionine synthetase